MKNVKLTMKSKAKAQERQQVVFLLKTMTPIEGFTKENVI